MSHKNRCLFALFACSTAGLPTALAQDAPHFASPVRLTAGEKLMGHNRLFPSPVFHDMNGDGLRDLVIGDLRGRLTVALRQPGSGPARFGAETKLLGADGKELDFANW